MASDVTIFDANVWIGYFAKADSLHAKARKLIDKAGASKTAAITEHVVAEVVTILKLRYGASYARIFLEYIADTEGIEIIPSSEYFQETIAASLADNHSKLSFVDVSLVVLSRRYTVETFDQGLIRALRRA